MARLRIEFTVEPFEDGAPGAHVTAAVEAARAAGLRTEFGPFSTVAEGEQHDVLGALDALGRAAFAAGASRLSIHVERVEPA